MAFPQNNQGNRPSDDLMEKLVTVNRVAYTAKPQATHTSNVAFQPTVYASCQRHT